MHKRKDPIGEYVGDILADRRAAYVAGSAALHFLGLGAQAATDLQSFMSAVLGPEDLLIELWQSSTSSSHPHGAFAFVLKLSARSQQTWKIIIVHLPKGQTAAMNRALDALTPTLSSQDWPREAIARHDDLFWWDDDTRKWNACPLPRGF